MKHFYKTLKRQLFILLVYTLWLIYFDLFNNHPKEKGFISPIVFIAPITIIHIIILLVYATANYQDDRKKLKNYLITIPIIFASAIILTLIALF